jgi:hypothetical protein
LAGKVFGGPNSIPIGPSSFYMKPESDQISSVRVLYIHTEIFLLSILVLIEISLKKNH